MKPETQKILDRINANIDSTPDKVCKEDFQRVISAVVELFLDEEPKIIDPSIDPEKKGVLFFKAISRMGLAGVESWTQRDFVPMEKSPFFLKLKKFTSLEDLLTRYSK